jgi:hypothetical protein
MITPQSIAGRDQYVLRRREVRHRRLLAVLRDLEARRITVEAACAACVEFQRSAERRGRSAAARFFRRAREAA